MQFNFFFVASTEKQQASVSWCICNIWVFDVHFHIISFLNLNQMLVSSWVSSVM